MYQDLSMHHDWPVKKGIADLPVRLKGHAKHILGNLLNPLGAQNKDLCAVSQTLLAGVHYPWCLIDKTYAYKYY